MKSFFKIVLPVFAIATSGCATRSHLRPAQNRLQRSVTYTEITDSGKEIPLTKTSNGQTFIPNYAEVDINSTIEIHIDNDLKNSSSSAVDIDQKTVQLHEALSLLANVIEARRNAVQAYEALKSGPKSDQDESYKKFQLATSSFGALQVAFNSLPLWNDETLFDPDKLDEAFLDLTYKTLGSMLQQKISEYQTKLDSAASNLKVSTANLQLEAFLEASNASPIPIHLPGYDEIEQRELQYREKITLLPNEAEYKTLKEQFARTQEIVESAEQVRSNETFLNSALLRAGKTSFPKIQQLYSDVKPLLDENWAELFEQAKTSVEAFEKDMEGVGTNLHEQERADLDSYKTLLRETILSQPPIEKVRQFANAAISLRDEWKNVSDKTVFDALEKTSRLASTGSELAKEFKTINLSNFMKADTLIKSMQEKIKGVSKETWEKTRESYKESGLENVTKKLNQHLISVKAFVDDSAFLLEFANIRPSQTNLRPPKSPQLYDVPVFKAPDTHLELQRTTRVLNDRVNILATLKGDQKDESAITLKIKEFGWHSSLTPSIILARAINKTSSADENFKFAPAITWVNTYYPRKTESGIVNAALRFFSLGVGLHAAFVDQDPNRDNEIGLGGTVSFWQDRVVAGVGWDLMANSKSYFYIGSNLIPILQSLGFGESPKTGKKP